MVTKSYSRSGRPVPFGLLDERAWAAEFDTDPPSDDLLGILQQRRDAALAVVESTVEIVDDVRSMSAIDQLHFEERLDDLQRAEEMLARVGSAVRVKSEPLTYGPHAPHSYFQDRAVTELGGFGLAAGGAEERLRRHGQEMQVEVERRNRDAETRLARAAEQGNWEIRTNMNSTDGQGGDFTPPLWLSDLYAGAPQVGDIIGSLVRRLDLPKGVDSIRIPRVTTGVTVATQTDAGSVSQTDEATSSVTATVRTITGQQTVSLQLLEQASPLGLDQQIFGELVAAYVGKRESQCINGLGTGNELLGLLALSGGVTVTYTDATPTVAELLPKVADAAQQVATNRKLRPTVLLAHPRRWYWAAAAVDGQSAPIYEISEPGDTGAEDSAPVGNLASVPCVIHPAIPVTLGATTNEDRIVVWRASDAILFESGPSLLISQEKKADTLEVILRLHRYATFAPGLHPEGVGVVIGSGLATPTF